MKWRNKKASATPETTTRKKIEIYQDEYDHITAQSVYFYNENKQLKTLLRNILQFAGVCLDELVQGNDEDYTALFEELRQCQERIIELHRQRQNKLLDEYNERIPNPPKHNIIVGPTGPKGPTGEI